MTFVMLRLFGVKPSLLTETGSILNTLGRSCIAGLCLASEEAHGCFILSPSLRHGGLTSSTTSSDTSTMHLGFCNRPYSTGYGSYVGLGNLRDNPRATRQKIRVGRGNSSRRGNYCGRGVKGQKARSGSGPHMLYDGGQLGLLKFPVSREKPPYEVLYKQLGVFRLLEYVQLGLLDTSKVITMKDLYDTGCIHGKVQYGVQLYGKVTACTEESRACIEKAGGSVNRVYYTEEGLSALMHPRRFTSKNLPLPLPAHSWHPRFNDKFDAIGQLPPVKTLPVASMGKRAVLSISATTSVTQSMPPA